MRKKWLVICNAAKVRWVQDGKMEKMHTKYNGKGIDTANRLRAHKQIHAN